MFRSRSSRSRTAAVLLLVALTVLAGCTSSSLSPLGESQPYETPLNATEVEQGHAAALEDAGSATVLFQMDSSFGDTSAGASNATIAVDFESGAMYATANVSFGTTETYYAPDGTGYTRFKSGDQVQYERVSEKPNVSDLTSVDFEQLTQELNFSANGTATVDGEKTWVYEAQNSTDFGEFGGEGEGATMNVSATLYITSDGLVKQMAVATDGGAGDTTVSFSLTQTYTKVGSTTVEEPDWLDEAKEQTGS